MFIRQVLFAVLSMLLGATAGAQSQLHLGQATYEGSGCPRGSATVAVSADEELLSVQFDQFSTEAGKTSGRRIDAKSCRLSLPLQVPGGYSVAIGQVDYHGFNTVPRGGLNQLDIAFEWAGAKGPDMSRAFVGPLNDTFTASDNLTATKMVWSACGASIDLNIKASMRAMANFAMEPSLGSVDSAGNRSGLVYHLQWKRCEDSALARNLKTQKSKLNGNVN